MRIAHLPLLTLLAIGAAPAAAIADERSLERPGVIVAEHAETGKVRFIGTAPGRAIPRARGVSPAASPATAARAFVRAHAAALGARDMGVTQVRRGPRGQSSVRLQQLHEGVPVVGGELVVTVDGSGGVLSAAGELSPAPAVAVAPRVTAAGARSAAVQAIAKAQRVEAGTLRAGPAELSIFDPRLLGAPGPQGVRLVWRMEVTGNAIDELVLVDALTGKVALHFDQIAEAKSRRICDADGTPSNYPCTTPVRTEGQPPSSVTDVNLAYDYSGDMYDFLLSRFSRDSLDGHGMPLVSTVRYCPSEDECPFANAFWDGAQMVYGEGFASADDVVGHEFAHGLTEFSSHLFYYHQSGAINESFSDVFGEFLDLTNGRGTDTADTRWQMGEDLPEEVGAIRDMSDPTVFGHPDRMRSPNYTDDLDNGDSGGVHSNSGVNNKAAFLITDGGTFNGRTVTGLGVDKAARIYYEAETALLTSGSDYADLFYALPQACNNLFGVDGITPADCVEVRDAVTATEMNLQPEVAVTAQPASCPAGQYPKSVFFDDLENPASGRWADSATVGASSWYYPQNSHSIEGYDATYGTSGKFNFWGDDPGADDGDARSDSSIAMVTGVAVPAGAAMTFQHSYGFETEPFFGTAFDGGVVEYSVNGGAWTDAGPLFTGGGYTGTLASGNPLGERPAFVDRSFGYSATRLNLSSLAGKSVRFRFRIGTDETVGDYGWFIDDVRIFTCGADTVAPVAKPPVQGFVTGVGAGTSTTGMSIPTRQTWSAASDDRTLTPKLTYRLQRSTDGAAFINVTNFTTRLSGPQHMLIPGHSYRYRVQARDEAGRIGSADGPLFTPAVTQENGTGLTYTGTWLARLAQSTAYGGFVRPSTSAGAKASLTFQGRNVAVMMPKASTLGTAKVCVFQGTTQVICSTIDLSPSAGLGPRRMVFARGALNPALTYRVEVSAVSGRIELDGIVVLR